MARGRLIRILTLLIVAGAILRFTGVIEVPGELLVGAIVVDVLLGIAEAAILFFLGRRIYRSHRRALEPFEALIETLREIEPKPLFVVMEKELRLYRALYRRLRGRSAEAGVE